MDKHAPEPTYFIDEFAQRRGHEALRIPLFNPELQPLVNCWGIVEKEIEKIGDVSMNELKEHLEKAFNKVTEKTCNKIIKNIHAIEDKFWEEEVLLEKRHEN